MWLFWTWIIQSWNRAYKYELHIPYVLTKLPRIILKLESIRNLICYLNGERFLFHFISVNELFKCNYDFRLDLHGYYNVIRHFVKKRKRSEVGLFIREYINFKIREHFCFSIPLTYESFFIEIISISISLKNNIIVCVLYWPNTQPKEGEIYLQSIYR